MSSNTNNINLNDFNNICRTCMSNCDIKFPQDSVISNVFYKLTDLHFDTNDELPQQICSKCYDKINEIYEFTFLCRRTHSSLLKCLNDLKNARINVKQELLDETNKILKTEDEITIDEHEIEFHNIELKSENNVLSEYINPETSDDLLKPNAVSHPNEQREKDAVNLNYSTEETNSSNDYSDIECAEKNIKKLKKTKEKQYKCDVCNKSFIDIKSLSKHKSLQICNCSYKNEIEENDARETEEAENIACTSLPEKSKIRYTQAYDVFTKWCTIKNVQEVNESVLLAYFMERSKILKSPASLWSEYSMLRLTISLQKNKDISKFERLKAFLKRKNDGHQPRKSKIFTKEDMEKFIVEAPDHTYLMMKVVAIMGVAGACRVEELYRMKYKDIEVKDNVAIVKILETKNNTRRFFVIGKNTEHADWLKLLQNYLKLRPRNAVDERFFFRYERGKCVNQVVGKHTISGIPRQIAKFLKLENVNEYTGHAFRKTSATIYRGCIDDSVRKKVVS